jgi:RND superfamily putative drug exporter
VPRHQPSQIFRRAERTAVPLALGILLVAFGAFLAPVLPVGLALGSFLAAFGLLALVSHRLALDSSTCPSSRCPACSCRGC